MSCLAERLSEGVGAAGLHQTQARYQGLDELLQRNQQVLNLDMRLPERGGAAGLHQMQARHQRLDQLLHRNKHATEALSEL